ncbi:MAG: hypothetical protein ACPG4T_16980, partial [Nannocystaceae bacterium]
MSSHLLLPTLAHACQPQTPTIDAVVPAGGTYPGNAVIRIEGVGLDLDQLGIRINGVPATAVPAGPPLSDLGALV